MAKMAQNFQNFRQFSDFCTNHERSIFAIKNSIFFFLKNCQNLADFNEFFGLLQKKCSSQNCSRLRPHRVMFFKNWKIAKIRQISSIFQKKSNFSKLLFVPTMKDLILELQNQPFLLFLEILPIFCEYLPFFTTILKES